MEWIGLGIAALVFLLVSIAVSWKEYDYAEELLKKDE